MQNRTVPWVRSIAGRWRPLSKSPQIRKCSGPCAACKLGWKDWCPDCCLRSISRSWRWHSPTGPVRRDLPRTPRPEPYAHDKPQDALDEPAKEESLSERLHAAKRSALKPFHGVHEKRKDDLPPGASTGPTQILTSWRSRSARLGALLPAAPCCERPMCCTGGRSGRLSQASCTGPCAEALFGPTACWHVPCPLLRRDLSSADLGPPCNFEDLVSCPRPLQELCSIAAHLPCHCCCECSLGGCEAHSCMIVPPQLRV